MIVNNRVKKMIIQILLFIAIVNIPGGIGGAFDGPNWLFFCCSRLTVLFTGADLICKDANENQNHNSSFSFFNIVYVLNTQVVQKVLFNNNLKWVLFYLPLCPVRLVLFQLKQTKNKIRI